MRVTPGGRLSHYDVLEEIGAGGMGVVYRALDARLNRHVALKILRPELTADPAVRRRFLREARASANFHHPNIAMVHDIDESDGETFLVMELVEGRTLRSRMSDGPVPIEEALRIAVDIAAGLARAHRAGIVHRDLKPENVSIDQDGYAKILDFGLAKLIEQRDREHSSAFSEAETRSPDPTRRGQIIGTSSYMSPEQARGETVDPRSDIFALGITLYEILTGRHPFRGRNNVETLAAILREKPRPPSRINHKVPHRLERIILRCLAKPPEDRYQRTDDLLSDLRKVLRLPGRFGPEPHPQPPLPPNRLWPAVVGVSSTLVLIIAVGAVLWHVYMRDRMAGAASPLNAAFLPFEFEGPGDRVHLRNTIPLMVAAALRRDRSIRVIPFDTTRTYPPDESPGVVADALGAAWVIQGSLAIEDDSFVLVPQIFRGDQIEPVWSTRLDGNLDTLIERAAGLGDAIAAVLGVAPPIGAAARRRVDPAAIALYLEGRGYLEAWDVDENYAKARDRAREAIAIDWTFAEAHAMLALALVEEYGETRNPSAVRDAEESAARALQLSPTLPEAYEAMGRVHLVRGRSAAAAAAFEKGFEHAPADDALARRIADAYARLSRDRESESMYRRAIELRPEFWGNHNALGAFFLERGRLDEAKTVLRRVVDLNPGSDTGYTNLAVVHILEGDHAAAEPLLRAALGLNPSHQTRNNLGVVYYAMGRFEDAAHQWRLATESGVLSAMLFSNLGDALRQLGRANESRSAYERAVDLGRSQLEVDAGDAESRAMLATALAGLGRCDDAAGEARRGLSDAAGNPAIDYYAAIVCAICRDDAGAIRHAMIAIKGGIIADVRTNPDLRPYLDDPSIRSLLN